MIRLSITKIDGEDIKGWDVLQKIKNECGFEDKDAVEFYPKETDSFQKMFPEEVKNWRHLYIFDNELPLIKRAEHFERVA